MFNPLITDKFCSDSSLILAKSAKRLRLSKFHKKFKIFHFWVFFASLRAALMRFSAKAKGHQFRRSDGNQLFPFGLVNPLSPLCHVLASASSSLSFCEMLKLCPPARSRSDLKRADFCLELKITPVQTQCSVTPALRKPRSMP